MKISEADTRTNRFVSIQKVLVAVDLSRHSNATATYAAEIAKSCAASLTTVYIYEPVPLYDYAREATYTLIERSCEDSQKLLDELTKKIHKTGVVCDSVFRVGDPAQEISALARAIGADLIVIGSHHSTLLARLLDLDKAPHIIHRAPCPVLVYHEKTA